MKKRIFITGGEGFIGSCLIDKLTEAGYETASYDAQLNFINNDPYYKKCLLLRKKIFHRSSKSYSGDIRNIITLRKAISDFHPNTVVHLAGLAMARVPKQFEHQMIPINMEGTLNVLQAFEESKAEKIVYTSSSMAYGHFKQTPQSEECMLHPVNSYGACKAAGEYFIKLSKKKWVIVRPTSVYGFADCANRVTQLLLDAAFLNKPAWVVKGETLDFSYIDDVASGFLKTIVSDRANFDTFNISRGEAQSAADFAEILKKYIPRFKYEIREPSSQQVYRGPLNIQKAKNILNFKPIYSIEKGIKEILDLVEQYNFYEGL